MIKIKTKISIFIVLMVAITIAVVLSCINKRQKANSRPQPNVILVTLDTLRTDHLGCYGYPKSTSPFIDKLAKKGIFFKNALNVAIQTTPNHASIFTSLYPIQHGAYMNYRKIKDGTFTMAKMFAVFAVSKSGSVS